jgi:hypothetical protein
MRETFFPVRPSLTYCMRSYYAIGRRSKRQSVADQGRMLLMPLKTLPTALAPPSRMLTGALTTLVRRILTVPITRRGLNPLAFGSSQTSAK